MGRSLTTRLRSVRILTQEGTQPTAPLFTTITLGGLITLDQITFRIPAGHRGTTGLQVQLAGAVIFPYNAPTEWLVGDDDRLTVPFGIEVDTQLRVATYNLDLRGHTHLLDVQVSDIPVDTLNAGSTPALSSLS